MKRGLQYALAGALLFALAAPGRAADAGPLLVRIRAVKAEGEGNADASKAWRELTALDADALPSILAGFDGASATAANWLRAAVDAIAQREMNAGRKLPLGKLEDFINDRKHNPAARRLAYEWLTRADTAAPARLLPTMLNDPSVELRRDAVELVLKDAEAKLKAGDKDAAKAAFQKGLNAARDLDQAQAAAKQLKALGENVDLVKHFGYITQWQALGPFDNTKEKGYAEVLPPEKKLDLTAVTKGKDDKEIRWKAYTTDEPEGNVNLNKALADVKDVLGYACTTVESPAETSAELRLATPNALKVWFNGEPVYAKEEYHHGKYTDQHIAKVTLKKGRNVILVKICQNDRSQPYMAEWGFQARICDAVGTPVPLTVVSEKNPGTGGEK
jgi:hypothetical protein